MSSVETLLARGVTVPAPATVHVGPDVDPERIEAGAFLGPGTVLTGEKTLIGSGARLSTEGPANLHDMAVGRKAELASGSFRKAVFLDGASHGPSAHVRGGTLFEEGASAAHATGTKQSVLLAFATLGSDVNFCDALLAGGTSAADHSEVGSGFIHFNFTPFGPRGDKATASRFGDVVRGVWMREKRIFLGGAGGVVGPIQVGYGTVLAAGSVFRRDRGEGVLVYAESLPSREVPFEPLVQRRVMGRWNKGLDYLADLALLGVWYRVVRAAGAEGDAWQGHLLTAADEALKSGTAERWKQMLRFAGGLEASAERLEARGEAGALEAEEQRRLSAHAAAGTPEAALADWRGRSEAALGRWLAEQPSPAGLAHLAWLADLREEQVQAGRSLLQSLREDWLRVHAPAA